MMMNNTPLCRGLGLGSASDWAADWASDSTQVVIDR